MELVGKKSSWLRAPGWLSWLNIRLLVSAQAQVTISRLHEFEPLIRLCADRRESAWDSLFLPLSLPLPCSCSLPSSPLKINKYRGAWVAQSVKHLTLDLMRLSPASGSVLIAQKLLGILSFSLSLCPYPALSALSK